MGCVWKQRCEQGCEGHVGSPGGEDSGGQGQMAHEAHVDMPGNVARPEPPPVNVTQRPQPGHSNSRIRGKPQVTGPVRPHLRDSTCAPLGTPDAPRGSTAPGAEAGEGHTVSPGRRKMSGFLLQPRSCCHSERLPRGTQCCSFLTSQSRSSSGFFMVRDAICQ